jgi:hypothetical protein
MYAWSQLNFSAIPVSISAVSLTGGKTWQNITELQRIENVQEGKRHQKKETSSCFWFLLFLGRSFQQLTPQFVECDTGD